MKPLRVYCLVCCGNYPKIGKKLIFSDDLDRYDYKKADWGSNFTDYFEHIQMVLRALKPIDNEHYPNALVITNQKLIVKAIIPITQHTNMKNADKEVEVDE